MLRKRFLQWFWVVLLVSLLGGCASRQPVEAPSPPPPSEGSRPSLPLMGYTLQAGAFAEPQNAVRLTRRLTALGLAAYYFRGEGALYRVRFGNYSSYAAALERAVGLQRDGVIDVYIVVRPESYPAVKYRDRADRLREQTVEVARQYLGVPYRWGDVSPVLGFDCSGLAMMVYQLIGLEMPRISRDQFRAGRPVAREQLRPGDLVFFAADSGSKVSHVGIYIGHDRFIHAPSRGKQVSQASLSSRYFRKRYLGGRAYL